MEKEFFIKAIEALQSDDRSSKEIANVFYNYTCSPKMVFRMSASEKFIFDMLKEEYEETDIILNFLYRNNGEILTIIAPNIVFEINNSIDLYYYLEITKAKDKIRVACLYMKDLGMFAKMPLSDLVEYVCNNYETLMEFAPGNIKSILACIKKGYWKL